jgi:hypothetical protein
VAEKPKDRRLKVVDRRAPRVTFVEQVERHGKPVEGDVSTQQHVTEAGFRDADDEAILLPEVDPVASFDAHLDGGRRERSFDGPR